MRIPLKEYARRNNRTYQTIHEKAKNGRFQTAVKVGNTWLIDDGEIYRDNRVKTGEYVGWHKKYYKHK